MDDSNDDRWIHDLLDESVPVDELSVGFEERLRGELRRSWRKSPRRPHAEIARRRKMFLGVACAAFVVVAVAGVVVLRPDGKNSVNSPRESEPSPTTGPPPSADPTLQTASSTDPTVTTTAESDASAAPTSSSIPVVPTESSVTLTLGNGAARLPATRVVAALDLSQLTNVEVVLAPDGRIVLAHDVDGRRRLFTVSAIGELTDIGINLVPGSTFLFGAHGDLYTLQRFDQSNAQISEYHPTSSGRWEWVGSGAGGTVGPDCVLAVTPDGASCAGGVGFRSGDPQNFDRVVADPSLGTTGARASIARTGGAYEHTWTTELVMQRALSCTGRTCASALFPGPAGSVVWAPPADGGEPDRAVFVLDDRAAAGAAWLDPSIETVVGVEGNELIAVRQVYGAKTLVGVDLTSILDPAAMTAPAPHDPSIDSGQPGFVPECGETVSATAPIGGPIASGSSFQSFGPLGARPSIDITLPLSRSEYSDQVLEPSAWTVTIPGGFLVRVTSSSSGYFAGSMYAAVDLDGSVRWVRCFPDTSHSLYVAPVSTGPTSAYVQFSRDNEDRSAPPTRRVDRISLADGSVTATMADVFADNGVSTDPPVDPEPLAASRTALLFGPPRDAAAGPTDRLIRFDLTTDAFTEIPYPPSAAVGQHFTLSPDDTVVALGDSNLSAASAAYVDGAWTAAADVLATVFPSRADFSFDPGDPVLKGIDGAGRTLWTDPSIIAPPGEGFRSATSGDVSIVRGCTAFDQIQGCVGAALWGVDPSNGEVLWHLDGIRNVAAVADGLALISEPISDSSAGAAWVMIDLHTGRQVDPTQRWADPTTFETQCCGGGEFVHVSVQDGIVFAVNGDRIAVWYPASESVPTVTVTLP